MTNRQIGSILATYIAAAMSGMSKGNAEQTSLRTLVAGFNVYAPAFDTGPNKHILYFGGWLKETDKPRDKIYRCQVAVGGGCGVPETVLTPSDMPVKTQHVNDPSVITIDDRTVLAFTACMNECDTQDQNEVWLAVSKAGGDFQVVGSVLKSGASEPQLIRFRDKIMLFFTVRGEGGKIRFITVDPATLLPTGPSLIAYDDLGHNVSGVTAAPDGSGLLVAWNRFNLDTSVSPPRLGSIDIALSRIGADFHWQQPSVVHTSVSAPACAALTPAIWNVQSATVDIAYGVVNSAQGVCRLNAWSHTVVSETVSKPAP